MDMKRVMFTLFVVSIVGCATFGEKICSNTDIADRRLELAKAACVPAASAIPGDTVVGTKACSKSVDILMDGLDLGCILTAENPE